MTRIAFWFFSTVLCSVGTPTVAQAAVSISEIAWMGTAESANYEWIELYNSEGGVVDVTDWIITDGNNFSVALSGSIPSDTYVVLERNRSSGNYISTEPFLIYTGALVNTGATLTLYNAMGDMVDRVADDLSVDGWDVGGDNTTKDTAQYTVNGWGTGKPTPGTANTTLVTEAHDSAPTVVSGTSRILFPKNSESVRLTLANVDLQLATDIQEVATVGQVVPMEVYPSGIGETVMHSLVYRWNFGDGYATSGVKKLSHTYQFPGTYVVTVEAAYLRHTQIAEHTIVILPATFSITQNTAGDIQINNESPYAVDISDYTLVADRSFTFPSKTIIAPKATVTISHYLVLQEVGSDIALYDMSHRVVATLWPKSGGAANVDTGLDAIPSSLGSLPQVSAVEAFTFSDSKKSISEILATSAATIVPTMPTNMVSSESSSRNPWWPYVACVLVVGCGLAAILVPKQPDIQMEVPKGGFFTPPIDESVK